MFFAFQFQNRNEDASSEADAEAGSRTSVRESSKKKAYPVDPPPAYLQADLFSQMEVQKDKSGDHIDVDGICRVTYLAGKILSLIWICNVSPSCLASCLGRCDFKFPWVDVVKVADQQLLELSELSQ